MINKARSAVHNRVVVQQLDVAWLQLHVHSKFVQGCKAIEFCKGSQLCGCQAGHLCMSLAQLVVVVCIEATQMALHTTHAF